jgi:UDP-N-acetylmuramoyl-L-alanyl-D-glutamate--2,6-diaminopimelate ligase
LIGVTTPSPHIEVTGITHDSRHVCRGDIYVALPGANTHGARFAEQAVAAGAAAIWTDAAGAAKIEEGIGAPDVPVLVGDQPRRRLGDVAALVYGEPAGKLLLFGVTGTNGKTTTTYLIEAGLRRAGYTTGVIGTVETRIAGSQVPSIRTTPEATEVHALLAVMHERGVTACVMEVSSHALVFGRVDGIVYDVAGFTNLSQDHLDFHTDMEDYFAAKASLFTPRRARRGVVCVDDGYGQRLAETSGVPTVTVATPAGASPAGAADWTVRGVAADALGGTSTGSLERAGLPPLSFTSPLPGAFNVANSALAIAMLATGGVEAEAAAEGVAACTGVPGRTERVSTGHTEEPLAVVDYAHTPDAVDNVLRALRPVTQGRLIIVLGAGGDRDRDKRPLMGAVAARLADLVIVTDDNPRSEDPGAIRASVRSGAEGVERPAAEIREIADRGKAIHAAVEAAAGPADTVVIAGKGHEQGQEIQGVVHPFDDRDALAAALQARAGLPDRDSANGDRNA